MKKNLFKTLAIGSGLLLLGFTNANAQTTQTYTYTGSMQSFTVPSCVAQVTITVNGAQGANGATAPTASQSNGALGGNGGLGSSVMGVYPVTNGQVLNVYVGGAASGGTGGYNGGANGDSNSGGGGGGSDVRSNGTGFTDRIIVAGGGGGGGNGGCASFTLTGGNGGNGGSNGVAGLNSVAGGAGQGGTGSSGGAAGTGCSFALGGIGGNATYVNGGNGGIHGINACQASVSGGGGGGGYLGGGGGGAGSAGTTSCTLNDQGSGGGGAGGSNYFNPAFTSTVITNGIVSGNGSVVITYSLGTPPSNITATSATITAGASATLTANGATSYSWSTTANTQTISVSPTSTTIYTVTGYDTPGCGSDATSTVTVQGAALNFDGNNDFVNVPDNAALNFGTNDFTIEADFQSSASQPNYAGIVVKANNGGLSQGWQLVMVNNHIAAEFMGSGNFLGAGDGLEGTTALNDGNWHHLAMVVNRANSNIKLLVDGNTEANVTNLAVGTTDVSNNAVDMLFGVERTYALFAGGNMDEVRIWNRALCNEEIQNNISGEVATNANGLVAYYKFNQGADNSDNTASVTNVTDALGSNNGLFNNFTLTGTTSNFVALGGVTTGNMAPAFSNTLSAVATATNVVNCYGDATGTASVTASGIESPFTYAWSSGGTGSAQGSLFAGTYTCTIGNGCGTITQTVTITQPTQLVASSISGAILCNGGVTTVTVTETGGTSPYINDGVMSNITAGSYTYTVTDDNSCTSTTTITVTEPNVLAVSQILFSNVTCNGLSDGTADVIMMGGTPAYSYTWSPLGINGSPANNLPANNYTCNITDANGCTASATVAITQPNAVDASVTVNSTTITASNATATYQWVDCNNSNAPVSGATNQSFTPVANGTYAVEVTQAGCTATSTCTTISTVGIAKYNATNNLQVYPNPFINELTITSTAKTNAMLFDMLGNKINEFSLQNTTQTISLGDLTPGMYYLQVGNSKIKIIKQ